MPRNKMEELISRCQIKTGQKILNKHTLFAVLPRVEDNSLENSSVSNRRLACGSLPTSHSLLVSGSNPFD